MAEKSSDRGSIVYGRAFGSIMRRSAEKSTSLPVQLCQRHVPPTTRSASGKAAATRVRWARADGSQTSSQSRNATYVPSATATRNSARHHPCPGLVVVMFDVTDPRWIARRPRLRHRSAGVGGSVVDETAPSRRTPPGYDTRDGLVDERRAVEEDQDARDVRDACRGAPHKDVEAALLSADATFTSCGLQGRRAFRKRSGCAKLAADRGRRSIRWRVPATAKVGGRVPGGATRWVSG